MHGVPQMDEQLGLKELKESAATPGHARIRRQRSGAPGVPLAEWNGYSTEAGNAYNHVSVWYKLDGNTVTVYKAGKPEDYYTLS